MLNCIFPTLFSLTILPALFSLVINCWGYYHQETLNIKGGKASHAAWRNYDDFNEYFWYSFPVLALCLVAFKQKSNKNNFSTTHVGHLGVSSIWAGHLKQTLHFSLSRERVKGYVTHSSLRYLRNCWLQMYCWNLASEMPSPFIQLLFFLYKTPNLVTGPLLEKFSFSCATSLGSADSYICYLMLT